METGFVYFSLNDVLPVIFKINIEKYMCIVGKRSDDPEQPNWVPTIFAHTSQSEKEKIAKQIKKKARYEILKSKREKLSSAWKINVLENSSSESSVGEAEEGYQGNDVGVQCEISLTDEVAELKNNLINMESELRSRNEEIYKLREENTQLKNRVFGFKAIKSSTDMVHFFTGLGSLSVFLWLVQLLKGKVKQIRKTVSIEDHVLMVLMKLRLGLLSRDIAYRFCYEASFVSKVYRKWLPGMASSLHNLLVLPSRQEIRLNLPHSFSKKYSDCVCIIDCSEIFIERPKNLTAWAQSWSNYKHNNTMKYLIGISPAGAVIFLSEGWGGRVSDKQITLESGFLDKLNYGDCILADRGFLIADELGERGAYLKIPKFTRGKQQLPGRDVQQSRQLSNVRIHVERVIGQLKKFRLLQSTVQISQVKLLDNVMVVISAIINLNKSVVNK